MIPMWCVNGAMGSHVISPGINKVLSISLKQKQFGSKDVTNDSMLGIL